MPEIIFSESRPRTIGIMTIGKGMSRQQGNEECGAQKQDESLKYGTDPFSFCRSLCDLCVLLLEID